MTTLAERFEGYQNIKDFIKKEDLETDPSDSAKGLRTYLNGVADRANKVELATVEEVAAFWLSQPESIT